CENLREGRGRGPRRFLPRTCAQIRYSEQSARARLIGPSNYLPAVSGGSGRACPPPYLAGARRRPPLHTRAIPARWDGLTVELVSVNPHCHAVRRASLSA